jgi:hypothetical protein
MASASLSRDYFPIIRIGQEIENGKEVKPIGYFSCRASVTRFLGLTTKVADAETLITFPRKKANARSLTLADGTTLTASAADQAEGGSSGTGTQEQNTGTRGLSKGSKSYRLITGKLITPGSTTNQAKHSISFRFPGWATIQIVSNALGLLLNADTVAKAPNDNQVYPYFISPGGRRYPIATSAAATTVNVVQVPLTSQAIAAAIAEFETGWTDEAAQPSG